MNWKQNASVIGLVALLAVFGSGCLIAADTKVSMTGNSVNKTTFDQIKPGETSEGWIRATFGVPTSEVKINENEKVMKWTCTEKTESDGAIFLIFGGHDEKVSTHNAFVEVANGVVSKAWRD